jgi:hypothetical protein
MSESTQLELFRALRAAQEKYDYFILAASGTAIAFALTQTRDQGLSPVHALLGAAILCWGLSFYSGCKHLLHASSILWSNAELVKTQDGDNPLVGRNQQAADYIIDLIRKSLETAADKSASASLWQFRLFLTGGILYIVWHIAEMAIRS